MAIDKKELEELNKLSLEKMRVVEQLVELKIGFKNLVETRKQDIEDHIRMHESNQDSLKKINEALYGNGKSGLGQRVHDIETALMMGKWIIGIIASAFILQVVSFFIALFRSGIH